MRPATLLPLLLGGAIGAAGILQGLKWRNTANSQGLEELTGQLEAKQQEIDMLQRENESLRSLAQGGGEIQVPPELIDFAESAIGLDFKSSPVVHQVAREVLLERVTASIESRFPPNSLDHRQRAWAAMGLLSPNDQYASQLALTRSVGARAWFDDQTGEAWVTDAFDMHSVPDQSALLRALIRILLHQYYPPSPGYPGDDAARARNALHHGAAMAGETRFLARQALSTGFTGVMDQGNAARDLLESLPFYIRGLATFPSLMGLPKAERLMEQEELLGALYEPPTSTAWFYPEHEPSEAHTPRLSDTSAEIVLEESVGMLGLQLWLATLNASISQQSSGWRGDRYRLTAHDDTRLDLEWVIEMKNEEQAAAILDAALVMAGILAGSETDPAEGELVTDPTGRKIRAQRDGVKVVFTNLAPDEADR